MARRDQMPGLLPPVREWTVPQLVASMGLVFIAFMPWLFLFWILYQLSAAPNGDALAVPQHAGGLKLSPPSAQSAPEPEMPEGVE